MESPHAIFPVHWDHEPVRIPLNRHSGEVSGVPATVAKATATYTKGILAWRDQSVGILNDQLLFDFLNRNLA